MHARLSLVEKCAAEQHHDREVPPQTPQYAKDQTVVYSTADSMDEFMNDP
jgi:hypothetical protein